MSTDTPTKPSDQQLARTAASSRERFAAFRRHNRGRRRAPPSPIEDEQSPDQAEAGRLHHDDSWEGRGRTTKDKQTRRRYLWRYYAWLKPFRWQLCSLLAVGLVVSGLEIVIPYVVGQMVDVVNGESRLVAGMPALQALSLVQLLGLFAGIGFGVIIVARVLNLWRNLALQRTNAQVTHRLREQLHERILRLPMGDLHDLKSGGVVSRLGADVDGTIGLVQQAVLSPLQAILRLAFVTVYLCWLSWQVTLVSLTMLLLVGSVYHVLLKRVRPIYRSMGEDRQRVDGRVAETFGGLRVVRSFAREHAERLAYGVGHHTIVRKQLWARGLQSFLLLFWEMLMPLTSLVIVAMGCWLVVNEVGNFTIGDVFQFQMLTFMVLQPVFMLVQSMTETQRGLASMERVYEILERDPEKPDRPDAVDAPDDVAEIRFDGVDFAYGFEGQDPGAVMPADDQWVIRGCDLRLPGGKVTALVGASGAGKSTLADLVARFHDPLRGTVRINGIDLRDIRLADYRQLFGIVQQEVFLFDGSIAENILYGRRGASDAELVDAARRANALEFIERLPEGFDSIIGERGVKLSGGQRQRLSIARAILANPRLLILDEATSNLDTESEQLIQSSLEELFANRTTLVVAHRLSTIQNADQIVVLDEGRIVQRGRHDDLMAVGPGSAYYDMVKRQELAA